MSEIILTIVSLFFVISCSSDERTLSKKLFDEKTIINTTKSKVDILGLWSITDKFDYGYSAKCNVCPKIFLKKNNSGKMTNSKDDYNFEYYLNDGVLKFKFENNSSIYLSENTKFNFDRNEKGSSKYLILKSSNNKNKGYIFVSQK